MHVNGGREQYAALTRVRPSGSDTSASIVTFSVRAGTHGLQVTFVTTGSVAMAGRDTRGRNASNTRTTMAPLVRMAPTMPAAR